MQRAVAVGQEDLSPGGKGIFGGVCGKIALGQVGRQLSRPEQGAPQIFLGPLVAAFEGTLQGILSADPSPQEEYHDLGEIPALMHVQKTRATVETFGGGIDVVNNFLVGSLAGCGEGPQHEGQNSHARNQRRHDIDQLLYIASMRPKTDKSLISRSSPNMNRSACKLSTQGNPPLPTQGSHPSPGALIHFKTDPQTQQHRHQRCKSYQRLAYSIRKMHHIFNPLPTPQHLKRNTPSPQPKQPKQSKSNGTIGQKAFRHTSKEADYYCPAAEDCWKQPTGGCENPPLEDSSVQKIQTMVRMKTEADQAKQVKKGTIISRPQLVGPKGLMSKQKPSFRHNRVKTEHLDCDNRQSPENRKQQAVSISQFLLSPECRRDPHNQQSIPGIRFKGLSKSKLPSEDISVEHPEGGSRDLAQSSEYLHKRKAELLEMDRDQSISRMYRLRSGKTLSSSPKQWHLYDCLRLSEISLYRTNLRVSCDHWMLMDWLQLKYLRGWQPKDVRQFAVGVRLLVAHLLLQQGETLDLSSLRVRINNAVVRNKLKDSSYVLKDSCFTLSNNTIISIWDLFLGMLATGTLDLTWHLIYALGHLLRTPSRFDSPDSQHSEVLEIEGDSEMLKQLEDVFLLKAREACAGLSLGHTRMELKRRLKRITKNDRMLEGLTQLNSVFKQTNYYEEMFVESTCVDISILFLDCLRHQAFLEALRASSCNYEFKLKVQVGYKFWETRKHVFRNSQPLFKTRQIVALGCSNDSADSYSTVAFHLLDEAVVVCHDSKVNMPVRDVTVIYAWMRQTFKRFGQKKNCLQKRSS